MAGVHASSGVEGEHDAAAGKSGDTGERPFGTGREAGPEEEGEGAGAARPDNGGDGGAGKARLGGAGVSADVMEVDPGQFLADAHALGISELY